MARNDIRPRVVIERVVRRFPERCHEILHRVLADDAFRALCEDYELAADTLRRLETVGRSQLESRIVEYRDLLDALGSEIAQELGRLDEGGTQ